MWIALARSNGAGGRPLFFVTPVFRKPVDMATIMTTTAGESEAIRARRVSVGLTQRQLAVRAAVSLTTVANIEAGLIPGRSEAIGRILAALHDVEQSATVKND